MIIIKYWMYSEKLNKVIKKQKNMIVNESTLKCKNRFCFCHYFNFFFINFDLVDINFDASAGKVKAY